MVLSTAVMAVLASSTLGTATAQNTQNINTNSGFGQSSVMTPAYITDAQFSKNVALLGAHTNNQGIYDGKIVTIVEKATKKIDGKNVNQTLINTQDNKKVWVNSDKVTNVASILEQKNEDYTAYVSQKDRNDGLFAKAPKTEAKSIDAVKEAKELDGKQVKVIKSAEISDNGKTYEAVQIKSDDNTYWVNAKALISNEEKASQDAKADKNVNWEEVGRQAFGVPYVYGGNTMAGFDCSGFVQYVRALAGKSDLGRTTFAQAASLRAQGQSGKSLSEAQPGDLLFWGTPGSEFHVEIYLGNGMSMGATQPGTPSGINPIWGDPIAYSAN